MAILAHEMLVNRIRTALAEKQAVNCVTHDATAKDKAKKKLTAPVDDARIGKDGAVQVKLGRAWITLTKDDEVKMNLQYLITD